LGSQRQPLIAFFWWALAAKFLASISVGLLFTYYYPYTGDTFSYFGDAARLASFARQQPAAYLRLLFFNQSSTESFMASLELWQQPRAFFMAKLVSILCLFTFNSYWLCGLYLTLFCFYELWKLANVLSALFPSSGTAAATGFLLLPSVVFWSAGLTKESIAVACISGIVRIFIEWRFGSPALYKRLKKDNRLIQIDASAGVLAQNKEHTSEVAPLSTIVSLLLLPMYLMLLWKLKYYYMAALLPALTAFVLVDTLMRRFPRQKLAVSLILLIAAFASMLIASTFLHPNLRLANFLDSLVTNHAITVLASAPENMIHFTDLQPTAGSVAIHLPEAVFSGLFRPLVWEANSLFKWYTGLENLLLLATVLYVLIARRSVIKSISPSYALLATAALLYIILLAALLALSSPNFGALSRYKVAFLPFFVYPLLWAAMPVGNTER
jgi:hypothetical protein